MSEVELHVITYQRDNTGTLAPFDDLYRCFEDGQQLRQHLIGERLVQPTIHNDRPALEASYTMPSGVDRHSIAFIDADANEETQVGWEYATGGLLP